MRPPARSTSSAGQSPGAATGRGGAAAAGSVACAAGGGRAPSAAGSADGGPSSVVSVCVSSLRSVLGRDGPGFVGSAPVARLALGAAGGGAGLPTLAG